MRRLHALPLLFALACSESDELGPVPAAPSDSATTAAIAADTLRRLGADDYMVDSLVARRDTTLVWMGPRVWMATDRPTTVVTLVAPSRIVAIRHIMGG